ncbi:MAG TPA: hypothetical protein VF221_20150 [Chloroflexota bacterium]
MRRVICARAFLSTADQVLSSASNFAVGVAAARLAGPAGLGAYAFAFTLWSLLFTAHRALITDPLVIYGDGLSSREALRLGMAAEVILGALASIPFAMTGLFLVALGHSAFGNALLALAPWLFVLLLQDYWRMAGFMVGRPGLALMNDLLFNITQAAALVFVITLGLHSLSGVVGAWGLGAMAGALLGYRQLSVRPSIRGGGAFLRSRWAVSRWLLAESFTGAASLQTYLIVAGAILGPVGLGGLRAAQSLTGPTYVLVQAIGSVGFPEASRAFTHEGWLGLRRVSWTVTALSALGVGAITCLVALAGNQFLRLAYGAQFADYGPAATIAALSVFILSLTLGPYMVLKVTQNVSELFRIRLLCAAVTVLAAAALAGRWGVSGAALAGLCGSVTLAGGLFAVYRSRSRALYVPPTSRRLAELSAHDPAPSRPGGTV